MHIRAATLEDIPQIIKLGKLLWELHLTFDPTYYQLEDSFDELFGAWAKEQLAQNNQFILVAENENPNQIVGFISGFIKSLYPWFHTKSVGHISYLVVDTTYRVKGIGGLLEKEAISWFKRKNVSYVEVYTDEVNSQGIAAWFSYNYLPFKKFLRKRI